MTKSLAILFWAILFLSCQNTKYVDIVITSEQRGWCFIIITNDTVNYKFVDGETYKLYLDSNNVAYLPKAVIGKGYNNRIYDKQGVDIKPKMRLFSKTGFDENTDMLEFYYPTEEELKLPDSIWKDNFSNKVWELEDKAIEKRDSLKRLGY